MPPKKYPYHNPNLGWRAFAGVIFISFLALLLNSCTVESQVECPHWTGFTGQCDKTDIPADTSAGGAIEGTRATAFRVEAEHVLTFVGVVGQCHLYSVDNQSPQHEYEAGDTIPASTFYGWCEADPSGWGVYFSQAEPEKVGWSNEFVGVAIFSPTEED